MALSLPQVRAPRFKNLTAQISAEPSLGTKLGHALAVAGMSALNAWLSRALAPSPERGKTKVWYSALAKPNFTPPNKVFGPAWALLYGTTAFAALRVWNTPAHPARQKALALWGSHLAFNAVWSRLFFGERRPYASLADVGADLTAAGAFAFYAGKTDKLAGAMATPLVAWLALAALINEEVVRKNRPMFR